MYDTWTTEEEARRLSDRFVGVNQAKFARDHDVPGGASMVSQHIKGRRPINLESATAYAKGFGVDLADISPRLALEVRVATSVAHKPIGGHSGLTSMLSDRLATADPTTIKLVELALFADDANAAQRLSPSLLAMVRGLKAAIEAQS